MSWKLEHKMYLVFIATMAMKRLGTGTSMAKQIQPMWKYLVQSQSFKETGRPLDGKFLLGINQNQK
jgi:hypothetical protein